MDNKYIGLAKYYDEMTQSGYYDFSQSATNIKNILGHKNQYILDLGIGTGELVKALSSQPNLKITGIDFSPDMIAKARKKLINTEVQLVETDLLSFKPDMTYDAIISNGGILYYINDNKRLCLYSHICGQEENLTALKHLNSLLKEKGQLIFCTQPAHKPFRKLLNENLIYEQQILHQDANTLHKEYLFLNETGAILARQECLFYHFSEKQSQKLFHQSGFTNYKAYDSGDFIIWKKSH